MVACFDLQQVLPCPHGQISVYFYKRKLSCYNLSIYDLATNHAKCFMWHEGIAGRGANEVNSCVFKYLISQPFEVKEIATFSDNCSLKINLNLQ